MIRHGVLCLVAAGLLGAAPALAEDAIDQLMQRGQGPADAARHHAYSDFTDPLGQFMDALAAGAFGEARVLLPAACAHWAATRAHSAFSGRFHVWDTVIDLDALCAGR